MNKNNIQNLSANTSYMQQNTSILNTWVSLTVLLKINQKFEQTKMNWNKFNLIGKVADFLVTNMSARNEQAFFDPSTNQNISNPLIAPSSWELTSSSSRSSCLCLFKASMIGRWCQCSLHFCFGFPMLPWLYMTHILLITCSCMISSTISLTLE